MLGWYRFFRSVSLSVLNEASVPVVRRYWLWYLSSGSYFVIPEFSGSYLHFSHLGTKSVSFWFQIRWVDKKYDTRMW